MGTDIDHEEFDEHDYARFAQRLEECLTVLGQLLNQPGFGVGPTTIGAELELFLIDSAGRPLPRNQAIRAAVADPRVTLELNRCNLDLNASPALLAGRRRGPCLGRSSTDCLNNAILVSSQSRWPRKVGELPATASTGAEASWTAL